MGTLLRLLCISLLAFFASEAFACQPASPSAALARKADNVSIGTVVNTKYIEHPRKAKGLGIFSTKEWFLAKPQLLAKVKIIEVLHGKFPAMIVTAMSPCALPVHTGERVVVAISDGWPVSYPATLYEESFKDVYGLER